MCKCYIFHWIFAQKYLTKEVIYRFFFKSVHSSPLSCPRTVGTKDELPSPLSYWLFIINIIYFFSKKFVFIIFSFDGDGILGDRELMSRVTIATGETIVRVEGDELYFCYFPDLRLHNTTLPRG